MEFNDKCQYFIKKLKEYNDQIRFTNERLKHGLSESNLIVNAFDVEPYHTLGIGFDVQKIIEKLPGDYQATKEINRLVNNLRKSDIDGEKHKSLKAELNQPDLDEKSFSAKITTIYKNRSRIWLDNNFQLINLLTELQDQVDKDNECPCLKKIKKLKFEISSLREIIEELTERISQLENNN